MKKVFWSLILFSALLPCANAKDVSERIDQFEKSFCSAFGNDAPGNVTVRCPLNFIKQDAAASDDNNVYTTTLQDGSHIEVKTNKKSEAITEIIYTYKSQYYAGGDSENVIYTKSVILNSTGKELKKDEKYYHFISSRRAYRASETLDMNKMKSNGVSYSLAYNRFSDDGEYIMIIDL